MASELHSIPIQWKRAYSRVPYAAFQREDVFNAEQAKIFEGCTWNFLGLEAELPNAGDFKTGFLGRMPVVMTRDRDGQIYAFENRCAHRGSLIRLEEFGNAMEHSCVYHAWCYDVQGNLRGVAFEKGVKGKGGMPDGFCREQHGPRKLRTTVLCGLIFASLNDDAPPIDEYLGDEILSRLKRVLDRQVEVIGRFTQVLPNNWKLYAENVRDTYHASLLHTFFTTFGITRLTQEGGVFISDCGGHHASATYSKLISGAESAYVQQAIRSANNAFHIGDMSMLDSVDEFGDGIVLQILSIFPGFVLQQINNSIAVRQILPTGSDSTDLHWTYLGFVDDTQELRRMRLKQANLVGPAGFVSMEDGAVGGFVQRGIETAPNEESVIELGGHDTASADYRATEASVRGFWRAYRSHMSI